MEVSFWGLRTTDIVTVFNLEVGSRIASPNIIKHMDWSESKSYSVVFDSLWSHGLYSPWSSPGQNTGVGSHSLLQGIFPTQGSNTGLPHWRWILHQLSHQGSSGILEWVAYPFSSGSSQPRNWTGVSCIEGRFFTNWATRDTVDKIYLCKYWWCFMLILQILILCYGLRPRDLHFKQEFWYFSFRWAFLWETKWEQLGPFPCFSYFASLWYFGAPDFL